MVVILNMESIILFVFFLVFLLFCVFEIYAMCKVYARVGIESWKAIIPIVNVLALFRFANLSNWMILLLFVPGLNLYLLYLVYAALADRLGKKRSFGLGFLFLPFIFFPFFAFPSKKKEVKIEEIEKEEGPSFEEPIEPLGARPDLEEIYAQTNIGNVSMESVMRDESEVQEELPSINNATISVLEETSNSFEPAVSLEEENPMGMITKAQYVEEEKENDILDLDSYKICPNCGTKLDEKAMACFLCGKRFDEQE